MIILIDGGKTFDKIQYAFPHKRISASQEQKGSSTPDNEPLQKKTYNGERLNVSPLRSVIRQGCPLLLCLFNSVPEILTSTVRQEKEIQGIHIGKEEVILSLFADDMTNCVENLMEYTMKLLKLRNGFSKVTRYKIDIQKSIVFILVVNNQTLKLKNTLLLLLFYFFERKRERCRVRERA